ncbi:MAG: GTPase [Candidatus Zixiibacteriota bacterium]|nr:MAG: GTPase [candidate division Zixibacteria bacterium]
MKKKKIIIMGAAGRDFHNFNVLYRDNKDVEVVAFTATQIPDIEGRVYPAALAGSLYPKGVPIFPEAELLILIQKHQVDEVVFSYSDVPYEYVMEKAAYVMSQGARFAVEGGSATMIKSSKPVISVCAVRTGCGKSQTTRRVADVLIEMGLKVVAIRHPMPYGDLVKQACQRFASLADMKKHKCTIEEMEEYEPHINRGIVVYAGVDYEKIVRQAEKEADVILWDGGNNDMSFYKADLYITVVDPHRPGHEISYYPGQNNLLLADVVVINKIDTAPIDGVREVRENIRFYNPNAVVVDAASPISVEDADLIRGKRVLVIEDGPTTTHGEMGYGAGMMAAVKFGAAETVDPRPFTVGTITETFEKYPDIGTLLPAMGYSGEQVTDLEKNIDKTGCDTVIIATPIDLRRVVKIKKPSIRVFYDLQEIGKPDLREVIQSRLGKTRKAGGKGRKK